MAGCVLQCDMQPTECSVNSYVLFTVSQNMPAILVELLTLYAVLFTIAA